LGYELGYIGSMKGTKEEIKPGQWRLRVYAGRRPSGSPIYVSENFHGGSRAADVALAALVTRVDKGTVAPNTITVEQLTSRYINHAESIGRSPTTVTKYRWILEKQIKPAIGSVPVSKLKASDLDNLYATLTAKGNKPTTIRRVHALIGAALHQGEKWDLVELNASKKATPPPVHVAQVEAPSPEDVKAIIVAAEAEEPVFGTIVALAATTGARRGELCGLRWSDVDFRAGTITIERSVYETEGGGFAVKGTKTHQARKIMLDPYAVKVLRRRKAEVDYLAKNLRLKVSPDGYLFSRSPQGLEPIRPDVVTKAIIRASESAGVKTHIHALRHFSATQMIAGGVDPVTVAGRLGHRDPSITLRVYSHALPDRDEAAAALVGAVLS
jgi:integrase